MRSLVGMFLPLFCIVDLEINSGLMLSAGELMMLMLNRLLIEPGVEHAMLNIWINFWLLESMVLQGSRIMSTPGIL